MSDVRENVEESYSNNPQYRGVSTVSTDTKVGERRKPGVAVYFDTSESGQDLNSLQSTLGLPSESDNISIITKEYTGIKEDDPTEVDSLYGGDAVDEPDDTGPGSATGIVTQNGDQRVMTADHVVDTEVCNTSSNSVYNYNVDGTFIGEVKDSGYAQDWATIGLDNTDLLGYDGTIRDEYGRTVAGSQTESGLKDLRSSDETNNVRHKGWATGTTYGEVEETGLSLIDERCSPEDGYVRTSCKTESGDSGGPHYTTFSFSGTTYLSMIAPHRGGESIGCAAYRINEKHNILFDQTQYE